MYLLLLAHILQSSLLAVQSCPAFCACTYGSSGIAELSKLVQCNDPGILAVPINVPADTVKLRLEKTLISRVPRAAFYNLSELQFLWLVYNSITSIHPSSFVNLKALRELRLDGNLLTSFPWEGLRDMPQLQTLGLHNNRLSSLPAHAVLFLPNITYLDLSSNRLTILPADLLDLWFPLPGQQEGRVKRRILVMQESPRVGVRWSIISLNGLSYKDAGEYRCQARNMAGISEAPIKLKVVGNTRLRFPKKKSQKTPSKSKYRKPNQNPGTTNTPSVKGNQILQNISPPSTNTQTVPNIVSKVLPVDKNIKRPKLNSAKKKSQKSASESSNNSTTALFSATLL
nr:PREDICTED: leucine-rich repeat, immunoglobulin-like domain and transmembrane domain-containing protein 3 isoform X3 [Paralichthys olivaceus]